MSKKHVYFLLYFTISAMTFSQINYEKIIRSDKKWFVGYKYAFAGGNCQPVYEEGNLFSFTNDTIINNKKYYKLKPGSFWVREDTLQKKVFGLLPSSNLGEKLIFNFNVNAGDTVFNLFNYGKYFSNIEHLLSINALPVLYGECNINTRSPCTTNSYLVVHNTDSVIICNKKRKRILFKNSSIEWIEGIGYKSGFLECSSLFKLKCFYENQCSYDFITQSENSPACGVYTGINNNTKLFEKPLKIRLENNRLAFYFDNELVNEISVTDVFGRTLTIIKNPEQQETLIDISDYSDLLIITIKYSNSKWECLKIFKN